MDSIILFDPSICSSNLGDQIIFLYCKKELSEIFDYKTIVRFPTQIPVSKKILKRFKRVKHRFICGSNLLQSNMLLSIGHRGLYSHSIRQWDINLSKLNLYGKVVLVGVGWQDYSKSVCFFTKRIWKKLLSKDYAHSVRDNYTLVKLKSMGIDNVINTGCATTWGLTKELCKQIPNRKANSVVFTITDYRTDLSLDVQMIKTLTKCYHKVFFWPQGNGDYEYFNKMEIQSTNIEVIHPTLDAFEKLLLTNDIDYVGTRLHGGIYALNRKKRTIIVAIDNRAIEMSKDINLPIIMRSDISKLKEMICSSFETKIRIDTAAIDSFKMQFIKQEQCDI